MRTIISVPIHETDYTAGDVDLEVPYGAKLLDVTIVTRDVRAWFMVDRSMTGTQHRRFGLRGEGGVLDETVDYRLIATLREHGEPLFVFEAIPDDPMDAFDPLEFVSPGSDR